MTLCSESQEWLKLYTDADRRYVCKEVDKMEGISRQIPPQIDNVTDATDITNLLSN